MKIKFEKEINIENVTEKLDKLISVLEDFLETDTFKQIFLTVLLGYLAHLSLKIFTNHKEFKTVIYAYTAYIAFFLNGSYLRLISCSLGAYLIVANVFLYIEYGETLLNYL